MRALLFAFALTGCGPVETVDAPPAPDPRCAPLPRGYYKSDAAYGKATAELRKEQEARGCFK